MRKLKDLAKSFIHALRGTFREQRVPYSGDAWRIER